jgi:alkanesulfonate monooxygenase
MLEETLRMAHAMWEGGTGTQGRHEGRHFTATRLLNSPQSISRPRVPIMIGGGGERRTLRLVAQYADASNVFGDPDTLRHKYDVLRAHCEAVGRPYEEIERSVLKSVDPERDSAEAIVDRWGQLAESGAQHVIFSVRGVSDTDRLEWVAKEVFPQLRPV